MSKYKSKKYNREFKKYGYEFEKHDYEFEKYACTIESLRETLKKYGVAIIPRVLDENECCAMVSGFWDFFEHITQNWEIPIKRNDEKSWNEFYKLYPLYSMLIQHWGVGHSQVCWDVRQNIKIAKIFAHFWGCDVNDLLVSFDGLSFNLPPETTKRGWNKGNTWYHTDQSFMSAGFKCIQSFITGLDVRDGDATLSVMEGSHKFHTEIKEMYNITNEFDWNKLTKEQEKFYLVDKKCRIKNIKCPEGSLVIWDSRTIHCGIGADENREESNIRAIAYVCMMPRDFCDQSNLEKKQKAFNEKRTTRHNPCKIDLFPKTPRTYDGILPTITPIKSPILNELGKRLSGF
ncbi:uncharacterized protein LOC124815790 [Hydra vulgaris]|uniref:uncharacterized protein LOC124815790 n=1 Tax=Hydra vulgaris TaxID=6087 RepID=UPI001F5FB6CA|nr:uncharacterized protein LOC124815790 [Hydra vulgaris]